MASLVLHTHHIRTLQKTRYSFTFHDRFLDRITTGAHWQCKLIGKAPMVVTQPLMPLTQVSICSNPDNPSPCISPFRFLGAFSSQLGQF